MPLKRLSIRNFASKIIYTLLLKANQQHPARVQPYDFQHDITNAQSSIIAGINAVNALHCRDIVAILRRCGAHLAFEESRKVRHIIYSTLQCHLNHLHLGIIAKQTFCTIHTQHGDILRRCHTCGSLELSAKLLACDKHLHGNIAYYNMTRVHLFVDMRRELIDKW